MPEDLAQVPLFADLSDEQLSSLLSDQRSLSLRSDQQLVMQEDWDDGVFLIRAGLAKVRRITAMGDEIVASILGPGDVFGEVALLLGTGRRSADVVSLTAMDLIKLRASPFLRLLEMSTPFARSLAQLEARRLMELGQRFTLRSEDAKTRVMATLMELACKSRPSGDAGSPIPDLVQREIAVIAGLARGTTSRILAELKAKGVVADHPEGLCIANLEPMRRRGLL